MFRISSILRRPRPSLHGSHFSTKAQVKHDVVVIGASVMDLVAYAPHFPAKGETVLGSDFQSGFGGKGANQAVAASRCGASVSMISKVGDDLFGRDTLKNFASNGIDTTHTGVCTRGRPTGCAPIVVDRNGDNAIVVVMAANNELGEDDVDRAREELGAAKVVVCQLEVPKEASLAALKVAKQEGHALTILNTAPAPVEGVAAMVPSFSDFLAAADVVCPNEHEAEALTGIQVANGNLSDACAAAHALFDLSASATSPAHVVLTLGKRGALWVERGGDPKGVVVAGTDDVPVDTVGAGDAFVGTFAAMVAKGQGFEEAIRCGNQYAGLSVTRPGTQSSYPTKDQLPWTPRKEEGGRK